MVNAQQWLKDNHENNKNSVKEIKVNGGLDNIELEGEIKFEDYGNLEAVELIGTKKLTKVTIKGCPAIREIDISGNEITEIDSLDGLIELRNLNCGGNKLTKINVIKNTKIVTFRYHDNPQLKGENITGLGGLTNVVRITGGADASDGIALNLTLISKEELEDVAKKLDIDVQGNDVTGIKKLIEDRGKRDRDNAQKLNDPANGLPGLLNTKGEVDNNKLKEINEDQKEIKQLHDVGNHANNAKILESGRFSQPKLDAELAKGVDYDQLVEDNIRDLVENGKISQGKINGLKDANKDAAAAITRLGVTDLKVPTLDAKLGDATNLSNIPTTLKDLLEENKKLKDDSNKLKATGEIIKRIEGDKYWQTLENQVLVEVNKKN